MTELELYKFINDNDIEWHKANNDGTPDIIIFPYIFQIEDFSKLLGSNDFDDGGIELRMMSGYFAIWMKDLCDNYDIDMNKVFVGEEK